MEYIKLPKIIKTFIVTSFILPFLVFIAPVVLSFGIHYVPYEFQPPILGDESLFKGRELSQGMKVPKDRLAAIGLSIRNFNLQTKGNIVLEVFSDDSLVRRSVISGYSIGDGGIVRFGFDPISHSSDKVFTFRLTAPDVNQEKAFRIYTTDKKLDWVGRLSANEVLMDKPLSFLMYFSPQSRWSLIKNIYSFWFQRFWGDRLFAIVYFIIVSILVVLLTYNFDKQQGNKNKHN